MGNLESITQPHHILLIGEIKNEKSNLFIGILLHSALRSI